MSTNDFNDDLNIHTVQSYEDACQLLGIKPTYPKFTRCAKIDRPSMIAYHKLIIIIRALNLLPNGKYWIPDLNDSCQEQWRIWHNYEYHILCSSSTCASPSIASAVNPRLLLRSGSLAAYCAKQFKELWKDYLIINQE